MNKNAHLAHFYRYLWEEPNLIVVVGTGEQIRQGRLAYNARYAVEDGDARRLAALDKGLVAAGLSAVSLAERESWGYSINLPQCDWGLFLAVEPEGMLSGRVVESKNAHGVCAVQRKKTGEEMTQSHYRLPDADPVQAVRRYFTESVQEPARMAVDDKLAGALVKPLPGGRFSEVENLSDSELIALTHQLAATDGKLKQLDEVLLFYMCRCSDEMILEMITSLPANQRAELWGEEKSLSIECPRCGREYTINRQAE